MELDLSIFISIASAVVALFSLFQSRRMTKLTELALRRQSYETIRSLPSVEEMGFVQVGEKIRAKLIVFNEREAPFRVNCVRCYVYAPKARSLRNWFRSICGPFDWDYTNFDSNWNPKGTLDDQEHYSDVTMPFTLVQKSEILLVTINEFKANVRYKFEVTTSIGTAIYEGTLSQGKRYLPIRHERTINY